MFRRIGVLGIASLLCLSVLAGSLQAKSPEKLRDLKPDEIEKIKAAAPAKPVVEAPRRKMLVFWRCEGFFHGSIPVVNRAMEEMGKKTGPTTRISRPRSSSSSMWFA